MKKGKKPDFTPVKENQKKPSIRIKFKKTDQTHFILGNRAYDEDHKDRYALMLMSVILGGNMSSRLFIEVREKKGLAYYVRTDIEQYKDAGYIATQAGVEHKNLELAVKTILEEYKKISSIEVSEKELKKAKEFIKGKSIMNFEASDEVAMFFVDQEVRRRKIVVLEELFKKIDEIQAKDILRVAKDIFKKQTLNLGIIGPHKNEKELLSFLELQF